MKQNFYSLLLTALLGMTGLNAWAQSATYEIGSAADLVAFAQAVNGGQTGANAVLTDDIDLDGTTWTPIGNADKKYTGIFDGQGHAITNFEYEATDKYNGLFGYVNGGTVKNFSISGTLTSSFDKNGVVGNLNGSAVVSGIHSSLTINVSECKAHSGGIVGGCETNCSPLIEGCEYSGTLTHSGLGDCQAGIVGYTYGGTIRNCIFSGTIIGESNKYGGILGYCKVPSFGGVQNCLSIGKIVAADGCTTAAAIIANFNGGTTSNVKNNYYCLQAGSTTTIAIGNKASSCEAPHAVTAEQLASGEVCYLLNGDQSNLVFYQTLGTDEVPSLDASRSIVYLAGRTHCDGTAYGGTTGYSNTANVQDEHAFVDGFCSYCDALDGSYTMTPNADGYYEISSANLLRQFAILVNGGEYTANAILTADIDMTNKPWPNSIGDWQSSHMYKGKFDGKGFSITNLTFSTARDYHGLFGVVGENAEIKNFTIEGNVTVNNNSIGIVSYTRDNNVLISNIHSKLNFSGASGMRVGGIVGNANLANNVGTATIDRCTYSGTISASGTGNYGGIVGYVNNNSNVKTTISNCLFDGKIINSGGAAECGGIAGYVGANLTQVTIKNCLSIGTVSATVSGQFFGAVKNKANSILNSYYQGSTINGSGSSGSVTPTTQEATEVDETQLMGGAICFALNDYQSEDVSWFQDLSGDDYPTPNGSDVVYPAGRQHCDGTAYTGVTGYSNTPSTQDAHDFLEGFCTYCGELDVTYLTPNTDGNFEIGTEAQLKWFASYVKEKDPAANAILTTDIDLADDWTTPIGTSAKAYKGIFDGQGKSITGFAGTSTGYFGIIGHANEATIKNFSVNGTMTVNSGTGSGVIGWAANSTVSGIHSTLNIAVPGDDAHHAAGVVGSCQGGNTVSGCSFAGTLTVTGNTRDCLGGVAGYFKNDNMTNCANYGAISYTKSDGYVGGIAGYINNANAHITNSLATGTVTYAGEGTPSYGGTLVGRLANHTAANFSNNYWLTGTAPEGRGSGGNTIAANQEVTAEQIASGEVAYKLGAAWSQLLGTDANPVPGINAPVSYVGAAGYATLYDTTTGYNLNGDVKAYAAVLNNTWLELSEIPSIPESTPVVLKGGYYNKLAADLPAINVANDLKGTDADTAADGSMYILANGADGIGFYQATGTIPAGKAYFQSTSGVKTFFFEGDDATGISEFSENSESSDAIYNLAGQRISKKQKGINIVGNKKVLY